MLTVNQKKENLLKQIERYIFNDKVRVVNGYKKGENHWIELYNNKDKRFAIEIERRFFNHPNFQLIKINGEPFDIFCEWGDLQVGMYDVMINYLSFLRIYESNL